MVWSFAAVAVVWIAAIHEIPREMPFTIPDHRGEICFVADESYDERITCMLGLAGMYPPVNADYGVIGCCFEAFEGDGTFWALGEQHISRLIDVSRGLQEEENLSDVHVPFAEENAYSIEDTSETNRDSLALKNWKRRVREALEDFSRRVYGKERHRFVMEDAVLADLLVLDAADDSPLEGAYVTVSDDAVHLVNYVRRTDEDGYAVLPLIAGIPYTVTLRVSGYLQPDPLVYLVEAGEDDFPERIVTVSQGVTLSGRVVDAFNNPAAGAQVVVSVYDSREREIWNSVLDRPRSFDKMISEQQALSGFWLPERPTVTCDERGRFKIENVPFGKIKMYAVASGKMPQEPFVLDAREQHDFEALTLHLAETYWAWFRITDENDVPVDATITIVDSVSGYALEPSMIPKKSATRIEGLPKAFLLTIYAEGYETLTKTMEAKDGDEYVFALKKLMFHRVRASVRNAVGNPLEKVSVVGVNDKGKVVCSAMTEKNGSLLMEQCPKDALLRFTKEGYAPAEVRVTEDEAYQVTLTEGVTLRLSAEDQVQLRACTLYDDVEADTPHHVVAQTQAVGGRVSFEHLATRPYAVVCSSSAQASSKRIWEPDSEEKIFDLSMVFEKRVQIDGIVTEAYGAPVPYAELAFGKDVIQCDENGRFHLMVAPDADIHVEAHHWLYGSMERVIDSQEFTHEIELRLEDKAPVECVSLLEEKGISTHMDGSSLRIDIIRQDSEWRGKGLQRGDYVESCGRALVIVRDDKRLIFQFK